jgi:hypothetical protein
LNFSLLYAVQPLGHVKTKSKLPEYDLNVSTLNSHPNTIPFHPISSLFSPACLPNRAIIHQARQVMLLEASSDQGWDFAWSFASGAAQRFRILLSLL